MVEIKIDDAGVTAAFNRLLQLGNDMSPAMRAIAGVLHDRTEQNFADESGPLGKWPAVQDKKRAGGQILQDTGRLANSITSHSDAESASIGTNVIYAAIHQMGGKINKPAQSRLVRHRTDRKGNLLHSEHLGGKGAALWVVSPALAGIVPDTPTPATRPTRFPRTREDIRCNINIR